MRKTVTSYLQPRCQLRQSQGSAQSNSLDLLRALGLPRVRRGVKPRELFNTRISTRACSHLIRWDTSMSFIEEATRFYQTLFDASGANLSALQECGVCAVGRFFGRPGIC